MGREPAHPPSCALRGFPGRCYNPALMRLGCLPPLIAVALMWGGGQAMYTWVTNRSVMEVSVNRLEQGMPGGKWLRLTGGQLDTLNSAYATKFGSSPGNEIYVPLLPEGSGSKNTPIHVLVSTRDPGLISFTKELHELQKQNPDPTKAGEFMLRNLDKLRPARSVEGLVQYGVDSNGKREKKLRELYPNLAADAVILKEGGKPNGVLGAILFSLGLGVGLLILLRAAKKETTSS